MRPAPARLAVLIPALNEEGSVGAIVREVRQRFAAEVIVIDDHSADGTVAEARAAGAVVLPLPLRLGAWGAMQTGIRHALRSGAQWVITMDADGQHRPQDLSRLLDEFDGRCNVVIGADPERLSAARRLAWRLFRALTGVGIEDLTSGFRAYDHAAMRVLASQQASLLDYQDIGVLLLLRQQGLRIREVPVSMYHRQCGGSRVFGSWLMVAYYMLQTSLLCIARSEHPPMWLKRRNTHDA